MGKGNSKYINKWDKNDLFVKENLNFSNWMGDMEEYIKDVRMVDLRLINTHHSASYSINNFIFKEISICQDTSIYYQLYGGIRVFDFRPGKFEDGKEIYCGHGPHYGLKLYECFETIKDFLQSHPREFVIIKMESSNKFLGVSHELRNEKKIELIKSINTIFSDMLIRKNDDWFSLGSTTMNEIWQKNKQVMVVSHSFLLNFKKEKKFLPDFDKNEIDLLSNSIWDYHSHYYGRYSNTADPHKMKNHVTNYIQSSQQKDHPGYNIMYTCELQLTPQSITSVFKLTTKIHQDEFVQRWFREMFDNNYRLNIISLDFVFYNPQFVRDIIHSNYFIHSKINTNIAEKNEIALDNYNKLSLKYIQDKSNRTIMIDGDIYKIKSKYENSSKKYKKHYLVPNKRNKIIYLKLTSKKIKSFFFQFLIVDINTNTVKIKHCYKSAKNNLNDEFGGVESKNSQNKQLFLNVSFNQENNLFELLLSETPGLFRLIFRESQVCEIEYLKENTNETFRLQSNGIKIKLSKLSKTEFDKYDYYNEEKNVYSEKYDEFNYNSEFKPSIKKGNSTILFYLEK